MRFAAQAYALLLLLLPLLALFFWAARRRAVRRLERLADPHLAGTVVRLVSGRKAILKAALLFAGVFLTAAALTQPQMGGQSTLVKREGIDLLFALDVSKSMLVQDIRPSRLQRAKLELQALMDQLSGDRVGIVSFAGAAFVQCPLTTDYSAAKMFLKSLSPKDMPVPGTAVGSALKLAHKLFAEDPRVSASRLVVLLTDGEDYSQDLEESIKALAGAKIPVFVVAIGSESGEPIPEYGDDGSMAGYHKDRQGQTVMSRVNNRLLRKIADQTGGRYVSLQAGGSLDEMRDYVKRMQKQEFESSLYTQYDEKYPYLLWPAFAALFLAFLIDERRGSRWLGVRG